MPLVAKRMLIHCTCQSAGNRIPIATAVTTAQSNAVCYLPDTQHVSIDILQVHLHDHLQSRNPPYVEAARLDVRNNSSLLE